MAPECAGTRAPAQAAGDPRPARKGVGASTGGQFFCGFPMSLHRNDLGKSACPRPTPLRAQGATQAVSTGAPRAPGVTRMKGSDPTRISPDKGNTPAPTPTARPGHKAATRPGVFSHNSLCYNELHDNAPPRFGPGGSQRFPAVPNGAKRFLFVPFRSVSFRPGAAPVAPATAGTVLRRCAEDFSRGVRCADPPASGRIAPTRVPDSRLPVAGLCCLVPCCRLPFPAAGPGVCTPRADDLGWAR